MLGVEEGGDHADSAQREDVDESHHVADQRLRYVDGQATAVDDADPQRPLAGALSIPENLEEHVVAPEDRERGGGDEERPDRLGKEKSELADERGRSEDERGVEQESGESRAEARRGQLDEHVLGAVNETAAPHVASLARPKKSQMFIAAKSAPATAILTA